MIQINEMMVHELAEDLEAGADLVVVDLRQPWEYDQGHISGAINIPMMAFMEGYQTIPKDKKVVMQCYHGFTSLDASGYLISQGWESDKIYSLSGGITGWVQTYGINALVTDDES